MKGKEQRQNAPWKPEHEEIVRHTYFYYYTSSFAKPHLRDALAKIPHVFQVSITENNVDVRLTITIFSTDSDLIPIIYNNQTCLKQSAKSPLNST